MGRFFRWATIAVIGLVIVAAIVAYPRLGDRWMPAGASAPTAPVVSSTPRPTPALPPTPTSGVAAVVIASDSTTSTPQPEPTVTSPDTPAAALATPAPIATTSLLAGVTPVVAPPSLPAALVSAEQGGAPVEPSPTSSATATVAASPSFTATLTATPTTLITASIALSTTLPVSAPITATVTPTMTLTVPGAGVSASGEFPSTANAATPLYAGPDWSYPIVGGLALGDTLDIVAWFTEGTWYLLANGAWIPATVVDNPPSALPLVVPTPTPTITPTPGPTQPSPAPPTPTPTPTSLSEPICDCSADRYDCLGNVFSNQAAAQLCFDFCFRERGFDVHNLDPNLNGRACENLP